MESIANVPRLNLSKSIELYKRAVQVIPARPRPPAKDQKATPLEHFLYILTRAVAAGSGMWMETSI